jgi:hypothetical protein
VFDPREYEDMPRVPKKKIGKYIERGRFRKGNKISIEEKLRRFADSLKPPPEINPDDAYLKNLLYWRPPKQLRKQQKVALKETEESMLNLLKEKELLYENDLKDEVEVEDLDGSSVEHDAHLPRKRKKTIIFDMDGETIGQQTFYEPSSLEYLEGEDQDYNGLMNLNYARRQHLPQGQREHSYDEQDLRILHHQPLKRRMQRSRLNDLSIRRG